MEQKLTRFRELEPLLADPAAAKEYGSLAKVVNPYLELKSLGEQLEQAEGMFADPDMREMAEDEVKTLRPRYEALKARIEEQLLADPDDEFDKLILEIRAGTGGDEAALFVGDLYEMYQRHARSKGWGMEEISFSPGEAGGFKEVVVSVKGDGCYHGLRYESGGHRVQRVPKTETQGRIHTSMATVAVLPEPDAVQVHIDEAADIEWERMRAGGAGGQHVNKTESAVRIWYRKGTPDELEVKCQDERSQTKNYERAMRILRTRVFERQQQKLHAERSAARKSQIGSGDRNARVRTYNFAENRCTDHRIGHTVYKMDVVLGGDLDLMVGPMQEAAKAERLAAARGA